MDGYFTVVIPNIGKPFIEECEEIVSFDDTYKDIVETDLFFLGYNRYEETYLCCIAYTKEKDKNHFKNLLEYNINNTDRKLFMNVYAEEEGENDFYGLEYDIAISILNILNSRISKE